MPFGIGGTAVERGRAASGGAATIAGYAPVDRTDIAAAAEAETAEGVAGSRR